ncbi:MAG: flippase [Nitrososphaerota archaeon]|jgi:O-antigen/teichoic acid export membrane protein|uniref:flippase n=1 Tax=Candidatus Bathycorpusculum sp. TaxID=2994959 RepID=UPI002839FB1E|nr:flippase [Candidatus Termitimicrobium sp.]MCL2431746.1 flippase [Candidatus Termitimicrobium sp.]MDR0492796.1 flippase [Nitrososphaerota archaeon]
MSKTTDMAKVSAKGGFHVFWGLILSTVISLGGTYVISNLLGPDNTGLYTVVLGAPTMIATFVDWGMNTAIIRYTAQYNSENNTAKIRSIFVAGLVFQFTLGLVLTILSIALSGFLATAYNRPEAVQLIQIASIFVLSGALMNMASAVFTGMERLRLNSIMLVIQAIVKTGLIIALVVFGFGVLGATVGFTVGVVVASMSGVLLMYVLYSSLPKSQDSNLAIGETIKTLLKYGLPISIGTILLGFLTMFYTSTLMPIFVTDNSIVGNYSTAQRFVVLITFFATPVTTMLFPAFSKLDYRKNPQELKNVFQYSVKYAALLVVPFTVLVMALAEPAINTLFPEFLQAPFYLMLLSIPYLFTAIGSLSVTHLINSQGDTKYILKLSILQVIIGFPLGFVLISQFGIIGLIASSLINVLPGMLLGLGFIKKQYGASVDWKASAKIVFSSAVTGILTYLIVTPLPFISPIRLIIGVVVFVVVFVLTAVFTRTITRADLESIQTIVEGLGPLRKPLHIVIGILEKLISLI